MFVHTSRWEGFGIVLLEAMLAALPIVATRVSAVPEVVADGATGILVEPGDVSGLSESLSRLLADPDHAAALGRAGLERARSAFSVARMVDDTTAVYDAATATAWETDAVESMPLRSLVAGPPPRAGPDLLHEHLVQGPQQPALRRAAPATGEARPYLVTCSDERIVRGVQYRAYRWSGAVRNPAVMHLAGRRYRSLFTADNAQIASFPGRGRLRR